MAADPLSLRGRAALITGAASGIGAATARLFAEAGAHLALVDRDAAGVTRTAEEIGVAGGDALAFTDDVTDAFAMERLVDRVVDDWGQLDILVNNAAVVNDAPLEDIEDQAWTEALDVNLRGAMVCARAVVPHMAVRGYGRILSATSIVARQGSPAHTVYAAAKAGIIGMTRVWARELGPKGITANCVAPGLIDTEMAPRLYADQLPALLARVPAGRIGTPAEVASVYLFLASDLASFVNGAVVGVDGGLYLAC